MHGATTRNPLTIVCKRVLHVRGSGGVRARRNARHYGNFPLDNGCTQSCCTKMRRMQRLHTGRQMFGVALGCSSLLPRLECTWGKIVIIIKFRLVCLILRVAGLRGYFYVSLPFAPPPPPPRCRGHCRAVPGRKRVELHPQFGRASERASERAAESRCNRCHGNHPLRDTSGSLGIP